jgi:hypothetical protein
MTLFRTMLLLAIGWMPLAAQAVEDPGRAAIANVRVCVIYATNGSPKAAQVKGESISQELKDRLRKEHRLDFVNYRLLGSDYQPLMRSYESWAEPLKPSDEILVRFAALGKPTKTSAILDFELWMGKRKIIKTDARLEENKPLILLGPEWRGGRMVILVRLFDKSATETEKKTEKK